MLKKMADLFSSIFDRILLIFFYLAGFLIAFQVLSVSSDVIARYFFHKPIKGIISLNEWSLVFVTFLVVALLQKEKSHIRMDLIINIFRGKKRILFDLIGNIFGIFVSLVLIWYGALVVHGQWIRGFYDVHKIVFPLAYITFIIPLGVLLLLIQLLRDILLDFKMITKKQNSKIDKDIIKHSR